MEARSGILPQLEGSISPYLFIPAAKVLSQKFKGIKVNKIGLKITHVLFADDLILFKGAPMEVQRKFLRCLEKF
ncbi:hypothetical protein TorRG33x02_201030, partial [Trema orientale]